MWLACLFVAELFTFTALAYFENSIAAVLVLSLFVPLCISTGGNSGSQAATLITRAMALGHIGPDQWWQVLKHELGMGLVLGLTLGCIGFVRGATTPKSLLDSTEYHTEAIEVVVPRETVLVARKGRLELPAGAQLTRAKTTLPALVTLPAGGHVDRLHESDDSVVYRFPANTEIRFPTEIRWHLAMVIACSVASICLWGTLVGSMLPLIFLRIGVRPRLRFEPVRRHVRGCHGHRDLFHDRPYLALVTGVARLQPAQCRNFCESRYSSDRALHIQQRVPNVHLQYLALHFDRADQDPDLILRECLRIRRGQLFELFRHRRMLVGRDLQLKPRAFPRVVEGVRFAERLQLVYRIGQQQAQPGHILRRCIRLQPLDLLGELPTRHRIGNLLLHGSSFNEWSVQKNEPVAPRRSLPPSSGFV